MAVKDVVQCALGKKESLPEEDREYLLRELELESDGCSDVELAKRYMNELLSKVAKEDE
jgi:hypothetical protein